MSKKINIVPTTDNLIVLNKQIEQVILKLPITL